MISDIQLPTSSNTDLFEHRLALDLAAMGIKATPVYRGLASSDRLYERGDRSVIVTTLRDIPVVVEKHLSWQQVIDFRRDAQARKDLRRLTHWLDSEMVGKSHSFIIDEIGVRRERYEDALRRHGIETVLGALSATLDSRVLLGGAAAVSALSYAVDPSWSLAAGASIVVGKVAVHVAESLLAARAIANERFGEIAFVVDAEKGNVSNARPNCCVSGRCSYPGD
jgi:hypothetical protein